MKRGGVWVLALVTVLALAGALYGLVMTVSPPQCDGSAMLKGSVCGEGDDALTYAEKRDENRRVGLVAMPLGMGVAFVSATWAFVRLVRRDRSDRPKVRLRAPQAREPTEPRVTPMDTAYAAHLAQLAPPRPDVPGPAGPVAGVPPGAVAGPSTVPLPRERDDWVPSRSQDSARGAWMVVFGLLLITVAIAAVVIVKRADDGDAGPDLSTTQGMFEHVVDEPDLEDGEKQVLTAQTLGAAPTFEHCGKVAASDADRVARRTVRLVSTSSLGVETEVVQYRKGKATGAMAEMKRMLVGCPPDYYVGNIGATMNATPMPEAYTKGLLADSFGWHLNYVSDEAALTSEDPRPSVLSLVVQRHGDYIVVVSGPDGPRVRAFAHAAGKRLDDLETD